MAISRNRRKISTMSVRCNHKIVYLDFQNIFIFIISQTLKKSANFCFFVAKLEKIESKSISYVFYCFVNFLCISLFFRPFVFVVFFTEICGRHFLKHKP